MEKRTAELEAGLLFVKTCWPMFKTECDSFEGGLASPTQILSTIEVLLQMKRTYHEFDAILGTLERQCNALHRLRVQLMHAWNARP